MRTHSVFSSVYHDRVKKLSTRNQALPRSLSLIQVLMGTNKAVLPLALLEFSRT